MISAAQWKRAIGPLLDPSVEWSFRGKFTYLCPVDWVLIGVLGEGSSFRPDEVYVWVVSMPLFVPTESLSMNFGRRVPATFGLHDPAALAGALGLALNELPTQAQALEAMAASTDEARAYAALLLDDVARAQHLLEQTVHPRRRPALRHDVQGTASPRPRRARTRGCRGHQDGPTRLARPHGECSRCRLTTPAGAS